MSSYQKNLREQWNKKHNIQLRYFSNTMLGKWNSFSTYRFNKNEENTMYHTFMDGKINQFYDLIFNGINSNSFVFWLIVSLVISFIGGSWDLKMQSKIPRTKTNFMQISSLILILNS
jgi:hypothetical protein